MLEPLYMGREYRMKTSEFSLAQHMEAATRGTLSAQMELGYRFLDGQGVAQDEREALRWFRMAAAQGYSRALWLVGWMILEGRGTDQDIDRGLHHLWLAAEAGFAFAYFTLGNLFERGLGIAQDPDRAAAIYRIGADRGDPSCAQALGKSCNQDNIIDRR